MSWRRGLQVALALALLQTLATAVWVANDRFPAGYEVCEHLLFARKIANEWNAVDSASGALKWANDNRRIWTRATGVHLAVSPLMDDTAAVTVLVGGASMLCIAFACYVMGAALASPNAGVLAAALALLAPGVWGASRKFGVDLPLAAALALLAAWITVRPPWACWRKTLLCGLAAGLLCLVKAQLVFWVPWLVLATLRERRAERLALFAVAAAVGSAPFWLGDLGGILSTAGWHAVALDNPSNAMPERFTWAGLTFYPVGLALWCGAASWPLLIALGAARHEGFPLWCVLAGALLVHTLIAVKWVRYLLPAIPLLAVLAAVGLETLRGKQLLAGIALAGGIALQLLAGLGLAPGAALDVELAHPPVAVGWRAPIGELLGGLTRPSGTIGIRGPEAWGPDDFSRLEFHVLERWPLAGVVRDSATRHPRDLEAYRAARPALILAAVEADAASPPAGWREIGRTELQPAVKPVVGQDIGPPLVLVAWARAR